MLASESTNATRKTVRMVRTKSMYVYTPAPKTWKHLIGHESGSCRPAWSCGRSDSACSIARFRFGGATARSRRSLILARTRWPRTRFWIFNAASACFSFASSFATITGAGTPEAATPTPATPPTAAPCAPVTPAERDRRKDGEEVLWRWKVGLLPPAGLPPPSSTTVGDSAGRDPSVQMCSRIRAARIALPHSRQMVMSESAKSGKCWGDDRRRRRT